MKIWRKSRLSECHANLFANGRVRAIYVNISVMCAALLSLASCKPSARQTAADAEQPTDSTEAVTSADTLRLVSRSGETTAIGEIDTKTGKMTFDSEAWYTLDGVRLSGKPSRKGIYINNGRKIVIK